MNEENDIIFESKFSHWIAGMYWIILAFLITMTLGMPLLLQMTFMVTVLFLIIGESTSIMFIYLLWKGYTMKFIISKKQIIIYGLLQKINIDILNIETIQKTSIPVGFRLFGAQFLGGIYYFPGIGNASVTMSNFNDGVLITTQQKKNYIITPENPQEFIQNILKIKNETIRLSE
jgi:hypothetical protein